ncbi:MAG TPA: hypothetical protein VMT35_11270 [Ignavibacteriaceae bacterium]|nr:hypothetical protein [Ignavibacteriaceae bacterium]
MVTEFKIKKSTALLEPELACPGDLSAKAKRRRKLFVKPGTCPQQAGLNLGVTMIEIPESKTISLQAGNTLNGKKIAEVIKPSKIHKLAWYSGNPAGYNKILAGRRVKSTRGHGMFVDLLCDSNTCITIGDGTNIRYYPSVDQAPEKHQLLIIFEDGSAVAFTVAMYGGIWAYRGKLENKYHQKSLNSISPLADEFDEFYFCNLIKSVTRDLPAKALLATEQRIPGLGNGVLQDILFNAGIHPKKKKSTLSGKEQYKLFQSMKQTLKSMARLGGRDTEKDFFGEYGKYKTVLSKNTAGQPCPNCAHPVLKESYLGGAVYFCPNCQKIN